MACEHDLAVGTVGRILARRTGTKLAEHHHHAVVEVVRCGCGQGSEVYLGLVVLEDLVPGDRVDQVRGVWDRRAQQGVGHSAGGVVVQLITLLCRDPAGLR